MDAVLSGLNAAQCAAVTSPVDVLQVLAPPGSGKTKTLTSRVAYLLRHQSYKAWNVICLTFTIKSSSEMKERIAKLIGHDVAKRLVLGTFHSVCRRYLVAYGYLIGIKKDFAIADSSDQLAIIKRIHKRLSLTIDPKVAQSRISHAKSKGHNAEDFANQVSRKKNVEQQEIIRLFDAYETYLTSSNLLDYDDLLLRCAYLLRTHPSCVSNVEVVLVDEFQDTNVVQFDLLKLFAAQRNRITTVGDPDQSIYGWRSAEVGNLKMMQEQYPDTLIIRLEENYRSSGAILLAAQEVIEQDESRIQKSILPTHCPGTGPVLRKLASASVEADWTVAEIKRTMTLSGGLLEYSDFAILIRSAALSRLIESAMGRAGIPYRMVGGQKFFDRVEIKILLDYLRVISQPNNNDALVRIINMPARGIGATTAKAFLEEAENRKETLWTLLRNDMKGHRSTLTRKSKVAEQGLSFLTSLVITLRSRMSDLSDPPSPEGLLRLVIKKLDFRTYLRNCYREDHDSRWANVEELVAQASEYQVLSTETSNEEERDDHLPQIDGLGQTKGAGAEEALSMFLANVALAAAVDVAKEDDAQDGQSSSRVTVSTIHAAKGLEWPVVFVPAAYEGSIPHSRAEDTDEERRLLYVAMTRAQALLYLSCPVKNSQREETKLSPFLSTRNVGRLFAKQGPVINAPVLVDIARILRRRCPLAETIEKESQILRSLYDDQWPLSGEESVEAAHKSKNKRYNEFNPGVSEQAYKKLRTFKGLSDPAGACVVSKSTSYGRITTTMEDPSAFSYQNKSAFSSAATQLQLAKEAEKSNRNAGYRKDSYDMEIEKTQKQSKQSADLLKMWGMKSTSADSCEETNPNPHNETQKWSRADLRKLDTDTSPMLPLAVTSQEMKAHRVQPFIKKPSPQEYVLLSSSPPPSNENLPKKIVSVAKGAALASKPARTLHTTSISQLQSTSDTRRKTLGVRRNMGGWAPRPNNNFKVPAMSLKQT